MRPPSLEPSTPDVREPSAWVTCTGYLLNALALTLSPAGRGKLPARRSSDDRGHRGLVAEASGIEDQIVVRRQVAVVPVDLLDVGRPVLVRLLQKTPRLLFRNAPPSHHGLHATRFGRAQVDVEGALEITEDVGAAPPDDDDIARAGGFLDHLLGDREDGAACVEHRVEDGVDVRWVPGRRLRLDHRLATRGAERHEEPVQQRAWLLVLRLDLLLRELEPLSDLVDDPRLEQVGMKLAGEHLAHDGRPRPELASYGDDRHVVRSNLLHHVGT